MLLPEWLPGERARRTRVAEWAPALARNPEGFTRYSRCAEQAVAARAAELGLTPVRRTVHRGADLDGVLSPCVELTFADPPLTAWVYDDQVDIGGRRIERWDGATPDEALRLALAALEAAVRAARARVV